MAHPSMNEKKSPINKVIRQIAKIAILPGLLPLWVEAGCKPPQRACDVVDPFAC